MVTEGMAAIRIPAGVFYNPEMKFCRDVSVALIRAARAGAHARTVDATAGSGIRAIRYARECGGAVGDLWLVDISPSSARAAKANAARNGVRAFAAPTSFARFANSVRAKGGFQLIELDPFGTPVPFLHDALRLARDGTLLSVTATDTAVLCGAHPKACLKNYQAKPLNPFCCHEVGARILLGKIARAAAEFDLAALPLMALSHRHYFKVFVSLKKGAGAAAETLRKIGFISHCGTCLHRETSFGVACTTPARCTACGGTLEHAGPLWLGKLHDGGLLARMIAETGSSAPKLAALFTVMRAEDGLPPLYFELPRVTERLRAGALGRETIASALETAGFEASRTHFHPNALKTTAPAKDFFAIVRQAKAL